MSYFYVFFLDMQIFSICIMIVEINMIIVFFFIANEIHKKLSVSLWPVSNLLGEEDEVLENIWGWKNNLVWSVYGNHIWPVLIYNGW